MSKKHSKPEEDPSPIEHGWMEELRQVIREDIEDLRELAEKLRRTMN